MTDLQNHFLSTYSNALLSDWTVIRDILITETQWMKERVQTDTQPDPILAQQISGQRINDAFNGPFQHFFKAHLHTYAMMTKIESALTIKKEELFKEAENTEHAFYGISSRHLEKIEISTVKQYKEQCNSVTKQHHQDWQTHIQQWCDAILVECQKNHFTLFDVETQDLQTNQTITELYNRFVDLKLPMQKLSKVPFDFHQYFIVKSMLAIQSALARMQQAPTESAIHEQLKILLPIFKSIKKAEEKTIAAQRKTLNELTAGLSV